MDITSLQYFVEMALDRNITRTAERLFISQQTLSNHLQRLENEMHAKLFTRKPRLTLTQAGEFVLDYAKVILDEKEKVETVLADIDRNEMGMIRFGASTMRMNMLADILPAFEARYPNVELRLTSVISRELEPMVSNGDLDYAIVISGRADPELVQEDLMEDPIYLCVPDPLLRRYYGNEAEALKARSLNGARVGAYGARVL